MKQQKMVSLDEATALIASDMNNFSKWVRDTLHAQSMGLDIAESERIRARWVGVARYLAQTIAIGEDRTVNEIIGEAMLATKGDDE